MNEIPTQTEIQELLSFLPKLYAEGFTPTSDDPWTKDAQGSIQIIGPTYRPVVLEFVDAAGKRCWCDRNYSPSETKEFIDTTGLVEAASMEQLKSALTFFIRGERFCDGHWAELIRDGTVGRVLIRLGNLR